MEKRYSRLQFKVHSPLKIKDLTFTFKVLNSSKTILFKDSGSFDDQGFTKWFHILQPNTVLIYEVKYRNEIIQRVAAKSYPEPNNWSVFDFKTTSEITKNVNENIKEIHLDDGEVAWYLIKKQETVGSWASRVFKKPLAPSDWDILKANNPHLQNLVSIGVLQPGQVVVLSNSTTAKGLPKYKKQAQQAHKNLEEMKQDKGFDTEFFAQNYEFFCDAVSDKRTEVTTRKVFNTDHPLVYKFKQENHSRTAMDVVKDNMGAWDVNKIGIDAILSFSSGSAQRMTAIHGKLAQRMAEERAKKSGLDNPKSFKLFRQKYKDLYAELDREAMKRMFRWDQSIKTNNMRRMINQSALARGTMYKGGIIEYTKKMSEIGKMAKSVKVGGYLLLPLEAYFAYDAVQNAAPGEKTKTAVVEGSKFAGGAGGAALGTFLVLTVATGGTSLVVLGVAAGTSALLGWGFGVVAGEGAGIGYDFVESKITK